MKYAVIENGVVVNAVESEQGFASGQGWIELPDGAGIGDLYADGQFTKPQPDVGPLAAANAATAKQLLIDTDWCENASVRNTAVSPHLANGADFDAYRLALRAIVVDPPVTVESWPARPVAVWA